jgi:hypothetical protein
MGCEHREYGFTTAQGVPDPLDDPGGQGDQLACESTPVQATKGLELWDQSQEVIGEKTDESSRNESSNGAEQRQRP